MNRRGRVTAAAGLALTVWFAFIIADHGWNPSTLVAAGRDDLRVAAYIEGHLGPDFEFQADWGHDGKFVLIQAHDPWLLNPDRHAAALDVPVYRSQRVLVPALVSTASVFGEWGVVWAFPVLMVLAVMLGTWATAALIETAGASVWWGLVFLCNPGLFYSYRRGTVDVVAVALLMVGLYLASTGRLRLAGVALAAAVLAKEVMLVAAIGVAAHRRLGGQRWLVVLAAPLVAVFGWGGYVRMRLGEPTGFGVDALTLPFRGVSSVISGFPQISSLVALTVMAVAMVALAQAVRRPSLAGSAAAGFALLLPLLPPTVWTGYVDAWRAAAPLLALVAVGVAGGLDSPVSPRPVRETEVAIP